MPAPGQDPEWPATRGDAAGESAGSDASASVAKAFQAPGPARSRVALMRAGYAAKRRATNCRLAALEPSWIGALGQCVSPSRAPLRPAGRHACKVRTTRLSGMVDRMAWRGRAQCNRRYALHRTIAFNAISIAPCGCFGHHFAMSGRSADLPLRWASSYDRFMMNPCRRSHRGLSTHYIAPMPGSNAAVRRPQRDNAAQRRLLLPLAAWRHD